MEIDSPEWYLKGYCPCCLPGGAGRLLFVVCTNCQKVALVCDEIGTFFPNLRNLDQGPYLSQFNEPPDLCPNCRAVPILNFAVASSEQIQAVGFAPGEYE